MNTRCKICGRDAYLWSGDSCDVCDRDNNGLRDIAEPIGIDAAVSHSALPSNPDNEKGFQVVAIKQGLLLDARPQRRGTGSQVRFRFEPWTPPSSPTLLAFYHRRLRKTQISTLSSRQGRP